MPKTSVKRLLCLFTGSDRQCDGTVQSRLVTAMGFFVAGLLSGAGGYWFVRSYLFPPATIQIRGVLKFQAKPSDPSASANPPNGYFVESSATDRFYVAGDLVIPSYVGSLVQIKGTLSTECGPDGYPCYPKLITTSVIQAPRQK